MDEVLIVYDCKPVDRLLLNEIQLYETMVRIHVLMSIENNYFFLSILENES